MQNSQQPLAEVFGYTLEDQSKKAVLARQNRLEYFMADPQSHALMDWSRQPNYPRPDDLSSSRKRLAPQLIFKGGIFKAWKKRTAVAINKAFFDTLPTLEQVPREQADIAWFV